MLRSLILAAVCACSLVAWGGDDEVSFKPKTYTPRKTLHDRSYRESAYTPSGKSRPVADKRVETARTPPPSRWRLFGRDKTLDAKKLEDVPVDQETAYKQEKQISVSTIKADPRDIPDRKPFEDSGKKLADAEYQKKESARAKNPLLEPRQGVKLPE